MKNDFSLSPYDILDLSPESSVEEIKARYRHLILLYHPDKRKNNPIGIEEIVTREYFEQVQKAYKELMNIRRNKYMPDEMIDYKDDDFECQQHLDSEFRDMLDLDEVEDNNFIVDLTNSEDEEKKEFNKNFNKKFEQVNKLFKDLNIEENKGYKSFGNRKIYDTKVNKQIYKDLNLEYEKTQLNNINSNAITFSPIFSNYPFGGIAGNFTKNNYNQLSISTLGKSSISTSDLGEVFGNSDEGFYDMETEELKKIYQEKPEKIIQERINKREKETEEFEMIDKKTSQELDELWNENEKKLKTTKAKEDLQYQRDKSQFNSIWEKAINAKNKLLGYS